MMAAHWVATGIAGEAKALVICTDQSRESIGEPYEYVMGGGAVALLVSANPRVLELELELNGYWTHEVSDTFRPTSRVETGNGETSLYCYMDALEGAYAHFLRKAGDIDYDAHFKKHIYHVPFGGITFQAHRTLLRQGPRMKKSEAMAHFERKSRPGLRYAAQMGGTYSASCFVALLGLLDACDDLHPGDRLSIFSYGSGSVGEFYSARVGPGARELSAAVQMQRQLDARRMITVEAYEALERARFCNIDNGDFKPHIGDCGDLYAKCWEGKGLLRLERIEDHYRYYGWS